MLPQGTPLDHTANKYTRHHMSNGEVEMSWRAKYQTRLEVKLVDEKLHTQRKLSIRKKFNYDEPAHRVTIAKPQSTDICKRQYMSISIMKYRKNTQLTLSFAVSGC